MKRKPLLFIMVWEKALGQVLKLIKCIIFISSHNGYTFPFNAKGEVTYLWEEENGRSEGPEVLKFKPETEGAVKTTKCDPHRGISPSAQILLRHLTCQVLEPLQGPLYPQNQSNFNSSWSRPSASLRVFKFILWAVLRASCKGTSGLQGTNWEEWGQSRHGTLVPEGTHFLLHTPPWPPALESRGRNPVARLEMWCLCKPPSYS